MNLPPMEFVPPASASQSVAGSQLAAGDRGLATWGWQGADSLIYSLVTPSLEPVL